MSYLRHISCSGQSSEFVDRISFCKTSCLIGEKWEENVRSGKKKNKQATLYWDTFCPVVPGQKNIFILFFSLFEFEQ